MVAIHEDEKKHMERAFELAQEALEENEVPVGCVFVHQGVVVGYGRNDVNRTRDPTAHAEMVAIRRMEEEIPNVFEVLRESTLYVTLEPCIMCASGLYELGIRKIVYAADNQRFGGIRSVGSAEKYRVPSSIEIVRGIDGDRSIQLLKAFYSQENSGAPPDKRKTKKSNVDGLECGPRQAGTSGSARLDSVAFFGLRSEPGPCRSRDEPSTDSLPDEPSLSGSKDEPSACSSVDEPSPSGSKDEASPSTSMDESSPMSSKDEPSLSGSKAETSPSSSMDEPPSSPGPTDEPS